MLVDVCKTISVPVPVTILGGGVRGGGEKHGRNLLLITHLSEVLYQSAVGHLALSNAAPGMMRQAAFDKQNALQQDEEIPLYKSPLNFRNLSIDIIPIYC